MMETASAEIERPITLIRPRIGVTGLSLLAGLIALLPFYLNLRFFRRLFWFGDELHLLSEIRHVGFLHWVSSTFAENYVPLFKLIWGGATFLFDGSYFAMLALLWLTHALNAALFLRLLIKAGLRAQEAMWATLTFAVPWCIFETLGWSVQWSAVLTSCFFLVSLHLLLELKNRATLSRALLLVIALTAGVTCFSRGVVGCCAVASGLFIIGCVHRFGRTGSEARKYFFLSIVVLLPAAFAAAMIFSNSTGNHQSLSEPSASKLIEIASFAMYCWTLNPFFRLSGFEVPLAHHVLLFGILKLSVQFSAFKILAKRNIPDAVFLLGVLIIFDLGNALLLGIGRYHTGLVFSVSSRYQYEFLICFAPFVAVLVGATWELFSKNRLLYTYGQTMAMIAWAIVIMGPWNETMKDWSGWRGREGRKLLLKRQGIRPGATGNQMWLGIPPILTLEESQAVVDEFNLH